MRLAVLVLFAVFAGCPAAGARVDLYAASSLTDLAGALADAFTEASGAEVRVVTGASSSLARQIAAGAPASVFISANRDWIDVAVAEAGFSAPRRLCGNSLVVIGPVGAPPLDALARLPGALGQGRLAVADPEHVPAGIHAHEALEAAGLWEALQDRLAPADNVRAAVILVAAGAARFGIVYATDAAYPGVVPVLAIDDGLHAPIAYWLALAPDAGADAAAFARFLFGDAAAAIIAAQGFAP